MALLKIEDMRIGQKLVFVNHGDLKSWQGKTVEIVGLSKAFAENITIMDENENIFDGFRAIDFIPSNAKNEGLTAPEGDL